ncbi:hypothetical protein GCM10009804_11180 [Kribbella hippodromi]|uniref:Uncharacterized protein n=1 Tax=Kribbella hippodromi TaxID=434347 RepID=A0ABP4N8Q8_9ACTN
MRTLPPAEGDEPRPGGGAAVPAPDRIEDPVERYLGAGSTLEISGSGVWAGRPRPCYRSSSFPGPFSGPRLGSAAARVLRLSGRKLSVAAGSVLGARGGSWTCFLLPHQAK